MFINYSSPLQISARAGSAEPGSMISIASEDNAGTQRGGKPPPPQTQTKSSLLRFEQR